MSRKFTIFVMIVAILALSIGVYQKTPFSSLFPALIIVLLEI